MQTNRAQLFWMLQQVSEEERSGFLKLHSAEQVIPLTCFEGRIIINEFSSIEVLMREDFGKIEFQREYFTSVDHSTPYVSPMTMILDLVELGFSIDVAVSEAASDTVLAPSVSPESRLDSIENLEVVQPKPSQPSIAERQRFSIEIEKNPAAQISAAISFKDLDPTVEGYQNRNHRLRGLKAFNYTCLTPEVSQGLVTIIGFGFIAFSAFIVPRLFGGMFQALARVVISL